MLREWREDYTIILTSQFSRINARLVSQRNAYITMCFIGFFEISIWILMIVSMSEIVLKPNMEFMTKNIDWNDQICTKYSKPYLERASKLSNHLLPIAATLMCVGTFFCCYLCKPPYGLSVGVVLRYDISLFISLSLSTKSQIRKIYIKGIRLRSH